MRAVITGAAGFLGSHLVDRFLAEGWEVVGVDNLITGARENLAHLADDPRFRLLEHDVADPFDVGGPVDGILHFASPASPLDYSELPIETLKVGAHGTHNVLEIARRHDARCLLASTSEVYGDPKVHPQREDYWGNVNPVGPRGVYDEAKRYAEAVAMAYHRTYRTDVRIARIFNTYGPRIRPGDGRVVSNFVVQSLRGEPLTVYGDGSQTRSFCYVDDQIDGIFRLFGSGWARPVNIGNPREFTILELARIVAEETGNPSPVSHLSMPTDDPSVRCPDIAIARRELGWTPKVGLREGLRKTIRHFQRLIDAGEDVRSRTREAGGSVAAQPPT